jgi:membrane-associated protease RseP (regulator of RpoE activity)
MTDEQWDSMIAAQATWDATMAHNAVKALREHGGPEGIMVVLAGSGHVAYGVGIERQARIYFPGAISTVIPVNVRGEDGAEVKAVQASYADFVWGMPAWSAPLYPVLGISTVPAEGEKALKVILVSEKTPAEKAGFKAGDVLLTMDGTPVPDKETLNRLVAGKSWGDESVFSVKRAGGTLTLRTLFRREG